MKFHSIRPYLIVFGGFFIHLSIGNFYTFGNIQNNVINYMQNHSLSGNSVKINNFFWVYGLLIFGTGSAVSAGGFVAKKIGTSLTVLIGGWIMSINVAFTYFTIQSYLSVVALSYGLIAGIGAGLAYGVAMGAPIKWFPNHKGLVIGIVLSGFGLSSVIALLIQNATFDYITKKNLYLYPFSFVVFGCFSGVLQILGSVLLIKDANNYQSKEISSLSGSSQQTYSDLFSKGTRSLSTKLELKPHELIFEFDFWILWLTVLLIGSSNMILTSFHNEFAQYMGIRGTSMRGQLTIVNVVGGLCNAFGRIFWGYLTIRKSYQILMFISCLINSVLMGSLYFLTYISDENYRFYIFCLWVSILYFCFGGNLAIFPTTCEKLFGQNDFVCNYGLLFTANSVSSLILSIVSISFESRTDSGLFLELFSIGSALSIICIILTMLFRGRSLIASR